MAFSAKKILYGLLAVLILVYLRGLWLDIMDVDAAQYASIAMEMLQNNAYLEVQHRGSDYLDKPPLLFWASAVSYALLGLGNVAYKLPSFLAAMFGVYALWRFSALYYTSKTAFHAACIFFSAQALILLCNDVRTDTLLLGFGTGAVWQLAAFLDKKRFLNLFFAFVCIGLAMLAKGPIGLVMPVFAIGTHLVVERRWRDFFRWEWLLGLGIVALLLMPMCWGLYHQFDLHPDKIIHSKTGVSGLYFYFWEQSFGRITGENVWSNDTTPFYFVHTYLWAFLPWSLLLVFALFSRFSAFFQSDKKRTEAYSIGGFVLTFIALSMSRYKLPHYIFITLPWAAVLTADYLDRLFSEKNALQNIVIALQYVCLCSMLLLSGLLVFYVFPEGLFWKTSFVCVLATVVFGFFKLGKMHDARAIIIRSVTIAVWTNIVLNFFFYPRLQVYQGTAQALQYARGEEAISMDKMYLYGKHTHSMDVYGHKILEDVSEEGRLQRKLLEQGAPLYVCTDDAGLQGLQSAGFGLTIIKVFPHFQVALLNAAFLNPETREQVLQRIHLVEINKAE